MKFRPRIYHLLFVFTLLFASCDDEATQINNPDAQEIIIADSPLSNLMLRASANRTSDDDILDNASCFSVELPVTITVGNITLTIENEDGFDELEEILENFQDEIPEFIFPITVISADYTETIIENEDQLEAIVENCIDDDSIECVDFVYPISFSVLNTEFVIIDTININSNAELYAFLEELDDDDNDNDLVALNFPVTLEYASGETIEVNSNIELSDAISSVNDDCDVEDDNCDLEDIRANLKQCVWIFDDTINDFDDVEATFGVDFSLQLIAPNFDEPITGTWEITENNQEEIIIIFSDLSALNEDLGGEWTVVECDDDELVITKGDLQIELDQTCDETGCSEQQIEDYLQTCIWNAVNVSGNENLLNYDLDFQEETTLIITIPGAEPIQATYAVLTLENGVYLSIENVNASNIQAINGYYKLFECDEDRLKFTSEDSDNFIILEQDCEVGPSPFECFESFDAVIEVCDDGTDGPYEFDLTQAFANCTPSADMVTYHVTEADAETNTNAISNPASYFAVDVETTIYVRVVIDNQIEIFEILLKVVDCSGGSCTEGDVDGILMDCKWKISEFNGSEDLNIYELVFNMQQELLITDTNSNATQNSTWSTSTNNDNQVVVEFENIFEGNIENLTGNWRVVECTGEQLILHRDLSNNQVDQITLDKICD